MVILLTVAVQRQGLVEIVETRQRRSAVTGGVGLVARVVGLSAPHMLRALGYLRLDDGRGRLLLPLPPMDRRF